MGIHMHLGARPHPLAQAGAPPLGVGAPVGESPPLQETLTGESYRSLSSRMPSFVLLVAIL